MWIACADFILPGDRSGTSKTRWYTAINAGLREMLAPEEYDEITDRILYGMNYRDETAWQWRLNGHDWVNDNMTIEEAAFQDKPEGTVTIELSATLLKAVLNYEERQ